MIPTLTCSLTISFCFPFCHWTHDQPWTTRHSSTGGPGYGTQTLISQVTEATNVAGLTLTIDIFKILTIGLVYKRQQEVQVVPAPNPYTHPGSREKTWDMIQDLHSRTGSPLRSGHLVPGNTRRRAGPLAPRCCWSWWTEHNGGSQQCRDSKSCWPDSVD